MKEKLKQLVKESRELDKKAMKMGFRINIEYFDYVNLEKGKKEEISYFINPHCVDLRDMEAKHIDRYKRLYAKQEDSKYPGLFVKVSMIDHDFTSVNLLDFGGR